MEKKNLQNKKLSRKSVKAQLDKLIKEFNKPLPLRTLKKPKKPKNLKDPAKETVDNLQEVIDYLRVCIKYTVWDLEATRRENAYLRKLLKEK